MERCATLVRRSAKERIKPAGGRSHPSSSGSEESCPANGPHRSDWDTTAGTSNSCTNAPSPIEHRLRPSWRRAKHGLQHPKVVCCGDSVTPRVVVDGSRVCFGRRAIEAQATVNGRVGIGWMLRLSGECLLGSCSHRKVGAWRVTPTVQSVQSMGACVPPPLETAWHHPATGRVERLASLSGLDSRWHRSHCPRRIQNKAWVCGDGLSADRRPRCVLSRERLAGCALHLGTWESDGWLGCQAWRRCSPDIGGDRTFRAGSREGWVNPEIRNRDELGPCPRVGGVQRAARRRFSDDPQVPLSDDAPNFSWPTKRLPSFRRPQPGIPIAHRAMVSSGVPAATPPVCAAFFDELHRDTLCVEGRHASAAALVGSRRCHPLRRAPDFTRRSPGGGEPRAALPPCG